MVWEGPYGNKDLRAVAPCWCSAWCRRRVEEKVLLLGRSVSVTTPVMLAVIVEPLGRAHCVATGCGFEDFAIAQANFRAGNLDESSVDEAPHCSRNRFAARPYHLRDQVMGNAFGDVLAVVFVRQLEQQAGYPAGYIEQDESADLIVGLA